MFLFIAESHCFFMFDFAFALNLHSKLFQSSFTVSLRSTNTIRLQAIWLNCEPLYIYHVRHIKLVK
jgi:hypothetical protein